MKNVFTTFSLKICFTIKLFLLFFFIGLMSKTFGQGFSENIGNPAGTTTILANVFQNPSLTFNGTADVRITTASSGYVGASGNGNVFFTGTVGTFFEIAGINTLTLTSLNLSFGHYKNTTAGNNELVVEVSTDGSNYTQLTYSRTTGAGTANWALISASGGIPSTANLRIRFTQTSTSTQFRIDDIVLSGTACSPPALQSTIDGYFSTFNNTIEPVIINGNGQGHIIVFKLGNTGVTGSPVDGTDYSVGTNSDFSQSTSLIATGEKVVYVGTGSVLVTGLAPNSTYSVKVFEYSAAFCYSSGNAGTQQTFNCNSPTTGISNLSSNTITSTNATLSWTNGNGNKRLVVLNAGLPVTGTPVDGTTYTANNNYSLAPAFTPGTGKIVYSGIANTVSISGLANNTTYYAQVFELISPTNCYAAVGATTSFTTINSSFTAFDNFDRPNNNAVGIPSSMGVTPPSWTELESDVTNANITSNALKLTSCNTCAAGREAISYDMSAQYATTFGFANASLQWHFNMKQSRSTGDLSGFAASDYGMAFIIGANEADIRSATADGYAVIMGETGAADPIRLVHFTNGINNYTSIIDVPSPVTKTNYISVRVTYNPCTSQWGLLVRDDGTAAFQDPLTIAGVDATAINTTYTTTQLNYLGALWNHGTANGEEVFFDNISIPTGLGSTNTYVWNGSVSTDYQIANNWTPARNCTKVNDVLVFDGSSPATSTVINVPTQTIGKLLISGNREVIFKDVTGDNAISFLTMGGGTGIDFSVASGSTFRFDVAAANNASDALIITLNTGATGTVDGTVIFQNTNSGTAARLHQLFAIDAGSLVINGTVNAIDLSADPFGTTGNSNVVLFKTGSNYISGDGSNPFGLLQPLSRVVFETGSKYTHSQNSPPSFAGRVYANFIFDYTGGTSSVTAGSNTIGMTADNMVILNGTFNLTGSFTTTKVDLNIKGDLLVSAGASFNYSSSSTTNASIIAFTSSTAIQKLNSAGTIVFGRNATLELNNTNTIPRLDVETDIRIQGTLKITAGNLNLSTGNITMQSDATSTANVAPVNGTVTYGTGRFIAERFITSGRKWRLLAAPLTSTQTIREAWMENATTPVGPGFAINNPVSGYGTVITDENNNAVANGFDSKSVSGPSMKYYNPLAPTGYTGVTSPNVNINSQQAYMTFVRGDRSCLASNTNLSTTILRTKGQLNVGNVTITGFTNGELKAIGNPYPSRIDLRTIYANAGSNFTVNVSVWDPKLTSGYGLGAFQTLSLFGANFIVSPGGGSYGIAGSIQNTIESGQGFFVRANAGAGSVVIKETDKVTGSSVVSFTNNTSLSDLENLRTMLFLKDASANTTLVDGALVVFDAEANNEVDFTDALKLKNTSENISIKRNENLLAVEQKLLIENNDSIHINLAGLRIANYQLQIEPNKLNRVGRKAFLIDNFLQTKTALNLIENNSIDFTVINTVGSYAANRFVIVFKQLPLPSFVDITAAINADKTIAVKWNIANENEVVNYEVERSSNGTVFNNMQNKLPLQNNNNNASFAVQDAQPLVTDNYYRIKVNFENGTSIFSKIVKLEKITDKIDIAITPNIITNKILNIQLLNQVKGKYNATIINALGEKVQQSSFVLTGYNVLEKMKIEKLVSGIYTLILNNENGSNTSISFVVQ
jgi:hypothetical protein